MTRCLEKVKFAHQFPFFPIEYWDAFKQSNAKPHLLMLHYVTGVLFQSLISETVMKVQILKCKPEQHLFYIHILNTAKPALYYMPGLLS